MTRYFKYLWISSTGNLTHGVFFTEDNNEPTHGWVESEYGGREYRVPATAKEADSFLDAVNYFRKYANPMRQTEEVINGVECIVYHPNRHQRKHGVKYL